MLRPLDTVVVAEPRAIGRGIPARCHRVGPIRWCGQIRHEADRRLITVTNTQPPPPASAPPGWYPTSPGIQGYWDGVKWTGDVAPLPSRTAAGDDKNMAILVHIFGLFTSFLGPLVVYLVKRDDSPFIAHHSVEALNFQISLMIFYLGSFVLMFVLIGFLTFLATLVISVVFPIVGAVAASRGDSFRYPISIRFVS